PDLRGYLPRAGRDLSAMAGGGGVRRPRDPRGADLARTPGREPAPIRDHVRGVLHRRGEPGGDRTVPRTQLVSPWRRKPRRGRNHRRVLRSAVCVPRPEEPAGAVAGGEAVRPTADRLQGGRARDRRDAGPAWGSPRVR